MTRLDEIKKRLRVCEYIEKNETSQSLIIALGKDIQYLLELVDKWKPIIEKAKHIKHYHYMDDKCTPACEVADMVQALNKEGE